MVSAKAMSRANRPRACQRTSDVMRSLTAWTNRRPVTRSKVTGCSLIHGLNRGGSQPPAGEPGPSKPRDDVGAAAHDVPDQAGAVVLHGQNDGALVDAKVVWRDPPAGRAVRDGKGLVERRLEPVRPGHAQVQPGQVADGRDDDLRGER